jgi:hypothetical protein
MTDTATLITQLRVLGHLTRTEAQVARLRVPQATGDDVRAELRRNADDAEERARRIGDVLRDLGALPDPVTPVLGRVAVLVRGALEQAQPLDEALLGDLVLEHQLRDRARYVGALADAAGLPAVRALADDLDAAHTETVDWLSGVLTGLARGDGAALGATPLQRVAAQVTRAANAPSRTVLDGAGAAVTQVVSRAASTVTQAGGEVRHTVVGVAGKAAEVGGQVADAAASAGGDTHKAGRDAAGAAEDLARRLVGSGDAVAPAEPEEAEPEPDPAPAEDRPLPFPGFADLPPHAAVAALRSLDEPADVEAMLSFEQEHGDRPPVVAAARIRAGALRTRAV